MAGPTLFDRLSEVIRKHSPDSPVRFSFGEVGLNGNKLETLAIAVYEGSRIPIEDYASLLADVDGRLEAKQNERNAIIRGRFDGHAVSIYLMAM